MGFHDDIAAGLGDLRGFMGVSGVYSRGAASVTVTASPGSTPVEQVVDDLGTTVRTAGTDWLIAVDELILDGSPATPRPGDVFTVDGIEWEVRPLGSEPCFTYSDAMGTQYRIHTKQKAGQ